jgi:hypothetical protein
MLLKDHSMPLVGPLAKLSAKITPEGAQIAVHEMVADRWWKAINDEGGEPVTGKRRQIGGWRLSEQALQQPGQSGFIRRYLLMCVGNEVCRIERRSMRTGKHAANVSEPKGYF